MDRITVPDPNTARERLPKDLPDNPTIHWRIYYGDGRTIDSRQSTWAEAPSRHLVAVVHAINDEPASCEVGTPYYWHQGDWIARVWDPTLYLRQTGLVKFGRWASHALFTAAWREALKSIAHNIESESVLNDRAMQSGAVFLTEMVDNRELGTGWSLYFDNQTLVTHTQSTWKDAPSDGVLCATYSCVYTGVKMKMAMRRHTFYVWRGHELINTDDLDLVLEMFPQCKWGQPTFEGKSYRHQAEAIGQACRDQLEDLR